MTVLVTGAAGFIGSHTAHALLDAGHTVVGVDAFRPSYPVAEKRLNAASLLARPGFRLVEGDLSDIALEPVLEGVDAVVHLAAQPGVTGSWGDAFAAYAHDNILATQRLLEAVIRSDVRHLTFASSSSVYGDAPAYPCREDDPLAPVSPYGVTKLAAEQLCLAYARTVASHLGVTVLRLFTVYGPRQRPDMALRMFLEAVLAARPVTVCGDGRQTRDFTYAGDVANAVLCSLVAPSTGGVVLNIGGGARVSINEVLGIVADLTGASVVVRHTPSRPGDVRHTAADCARARAQIGFNPSTDLATGLAAELAWLSARDSVRTAQVAAQGLSGNRRTRQRSERRSAPVGVTVTS